MFLQTRLFAFILRVNEFNVVMLDCDLIHARSYTKMRERVILCPVLSTRFAFMIRMCTRFGTIYISVDR